METVEQREPKKKGCIICRVLRWIWRILLILLLIVGILFQGPWKVLTLLAIFLLACTILPRQHRKWFWATVGIVVIILAVWVFLPDNNEGWKPYTFNEELAKLEAARGTIPDEENAAILYNQLIEDYDANTLDVDFSEGDCNDCNGSSNCEDWTQDHPWKSEDYPEVADWLQDHKELIETLINIGKMKKCQFPITTKSLFDTTSCTQQSARFSSMGRWTQLLVRAGNNDFAEGRIENSFEKYITILRMAEHQYQQPILIDLMAANHLEYIAAYSFNQFIITSATTKEHLNIIEKELLSIKHDWNSIYLDILEYEKLLSKYMLGIFYEVNHSGKIRLSRDPEAGLRFFRNQAMKNLYKHLKELSIEDSDYFALDTPPGYWHRRLIKAKNLLYWLVVPSTPQKAVELIDTWYQKKGMALTTTSFYWKKRSKEFSKLLILETLVGRKYYLWFKPSGINFDFTYRFHTRTLAYNKGCRILIALQRYKNKHGIWPETLNNITEFTSMENFTDPINNDSFVYKLTNEGFYLYSKSENNIDDNGIREPGKNAADDLLIWPRKIPEDNNDQKME